MKRILSAFSLLALLALSGCVTTGGDGNLSARVDRQEQQIQMLLSQVGQVEQVLPGQAEMWSQMQTMRQEINMLNGKIDDSQGGGMGMVHDRLNRMEAVLRQMGSQLGVNVDALNTSSADGYAPQAPYTPSTSVTIPSPPSEGAGVTQTPPSEASGSTDPATALYDAGIKAFDNRRYKDAVVSFKDFVAAHPNHKLAGNAYFWQGESYFQLKDYARAALAYQEVITKFAGSPKMQSSMLKQGMALYHADKKAAGRERLQELVKRYPNSPEAGRAKQFLAQNK
ncbi:MAG: tol-pal system protein YbgF [Desulfovibrionaceae bacterium]|nr:tol-pal system protein YbgF [Desulfovibrionaceae bacterium]